MRLPRFLALVSITGLLILKGTSGAGAAPAAPTPLGPPNGAGVTVPFSISWSAVSDPSGILGYNWQISAAQNFTPVIAQNSTNGDTTQAVISGLANGTYFWRVQAASGAFEQGAWSAPQSFTVVGTGPGTPGTPVLNPTVGYSTLHPSEVVRFTWSAASDAASYFLQFSNDQNFPVGTVPAGTVTGWFDNIPSTGYGYRHDLPQGIWWVRVWAVSAAGISGVPSNVISYSVFYSNPVPPPPVLLSPLNGPTLTLPVALSWAHVLNPQPSGYEVQVSGDAAFSTNETPLAAQLTEPTTTLLSLTSGTKFWRVRSHQGMSSPTTTATTAWSATGTFAISTAPATPVSIMPFRIPLFSGDDTFVAVQLTAGVPAGGANIALASSNQSAAPVPPTIAMQGTHAWTQFQMIAGQVTAPTPVILTATLNGKSASGQFTVMPPALKSLSVGPLTVSGGASAGGTLMLNGRAPAGGAVVSLSSDSPAAPLPSSVTVPAGSYSTQFTVPTTNVTMSTPVTITATWNGVSVQSQFTVVPGPVPTSLTLFPATVIGGGPGSVDGTVTIASAAPFDQTLRVSSNNATVLPFLSPQVMVPAGSTRGLIQVLPAIVSVPTVVRIFVTGGGTTVFADLTVNPIGSTPPPATLSSFTVSPTSVTGGSPATGTVSLPSAAPTDGTIVSLASNLPGAATVPASVTVPAGATSASFPITTFPVAATTVQLSATLGDSILFASLGVNPPTASPSLSSLTVSPSAVVGGSSSTGKVTLSSAAPTGGAVVSLSDNSASAAASASVTVPAGSTTASFPVTTSAVTASTSATISAVFAGVTRTAILTLNPAGLAAPSLLSPASDARFSKGTSITFDWSDVAGAASYTIQVDDSESFSAPLIVQQTTASSQYTTSTLPATRMWFRVRANDAAGASGAWSAVRRFEVR